MICAFIERPSPLEKSSCKVRLFAQNCFRKYRQKVAAITLSKPFLIPLFNLSHKRPTFAFTSESGYTLGFPRKIAHSGSHGETGRFPPPATARSCAASGIATERIAGESGCTPYGVCPLPPASRPRWAAQFFCASAKPTRSVAIAFILWYDKLAS